MVVGIMLILQKGVMYSVESHMLDATSNWIEKIADQAETVVEMLLLGKQTS